MGQSVCKLQPVVPRALLLLALLEVQTGGADEGTVQLVTGKVQPVVMDNTRLWAAVVRRSMQCNAALRE